MLLESGVDPIASLNTTGPVQSQRYDIISAAPAKSIVLDPLVASENAKTISTHCEELLTPLDVNLKHELAHAYGAIGYVSYSGAAATQGISTHRDKGIAALFVGIYQWFILIDHEKKTSTLVFDNKIDEYTRVTITALYAPLTEQGTPKSRHNDRFSLESPWQCNTDRDQYDSKFQRVKNYLLEGDTYQINLSIEHQARFSGQPWSAFKKLRDQFGAPFSAFLSLENMAIASFSPERFIKIEAGHVITQPIKGTRKRQVNAHDDLSAQTELVESAKDRAENLMIVDLMRNDIGQHCVVGSVQVPRLFELQSFSNVHHLVSTVTGEMQNKGLQGSLELFFGALPGGSVTGAPKQRSMAIIEELEEHDRAIYCGSVFCTTLDGNLDSNILIRSLLFADDGDTDPRTSDASGTVFCWGGSGLVADSIAEQEYEESIYKISHLLEALAAK